MRLLERELADVAIHDPHVATPTQGLDEVLSDAGVVFVATNHSVFCSPGTLERIAESAGGECLVVDPWNCFGAAQVFAYASELVILAGTIS